MRLYTLCALLLFAGSVLSAENLVFNSSFELGDAGFASQKFLRAETNSKMEYDAPYIDATTAVSGRQSLRIPNSSAEQTEIFFREMKLAPSTDYNLSIYMKSSADNYPVRLRFLSFSTSKGAWAYDLRKEFTVGKEWKRYDLNIKTAAPEKGCDYYTLFVESCVGAEAVKGDLWIDDIQFASGNKPRAWSPESDLEVAASIAPNLHIMGESKTTTAHLRAINNSKNSVRVKAELKLIANNDGSKISSKSFELSLKPSETVDIPWDLQLPGKYGAFHLETEISPAGSVSNSSIPASFAMIGKYERRPVDTDKDFCVGVNMGFFTGDKRGDILKDGFYAYGRSREEHVKMLTEMGCRIVRDWGSAAFNWDLIEPAEGSFYFNPLIDESLSLAEKNGIEIMPVIGATLIHRRLGSLPKWLLPRCQKRTVWPYGNIEMTMPELPPEDAWRKYVRAIGEHYKGRIKHYEIYNEPNASFFPKEYLVLLKAAYEELKAADPNCEIVAFCSSGDWGLPPGAFLDDCAKLGGLKYADIASYHPYETPKLPAAERLNNSCLDIISKYGEGRTIPLWNTELFYLTDKMCGDRGVYAPADAAQRFLLDLGDGLGQSNSVPFGSLLTTPLTPHLPIGTPFGNQLIPSENYVAYNALARHFEGAKPIEKIRWANDAICYVYERDGKPLAAFWNYGDMKSLKLTLDANPSKLSLFDVLGNPVEFPKDGVIPLTKSPLYLETKSSSWLSSGMDAKEFHAMLKTAKVEPEIPLVIGSFSRIIPENGWTAIIPLRNCSGSELKGKLELQGVVSEFAIPAISDGVVKASVNSSKLEKDIAKVAINGKNIELPLNVAPGKTLRLGEKVKLGEMSFKADRDGKSLKLSFDVKDTTPSGEENGRKPWEQDCIEIFLDAAPGELAVKDPGKYNGKVARLFVIPYAGEGKQLVKQNFSEVKSSVSLKPDSYSATLEIPFSALGLPDDPKGRCIGFDVKLDDAKGAEKAKTNELWNSSGDAWKNRLSFGFIAF